MEKLQMKNVLASLALRDSILILAQLLVIVALALGLQFVLRTTGGTLFVFTTVAPVLVGVSIAAVSGVAIHIFRRRHSLFNVVSLDPGEVIFHKGDVGDCAYFIQSGEVEVIADTPAPEKAAVIATLRAGEYFGEMSLLSNAPRSATVRARLDTKLAVIGKSNFLMMLNVVQNVREDVNKTVEARSLNKQAARAS